MITNQLSIAFGTALLTCLLASCDRTPLPSATTATIYADAPTYQAFREPETPWYGTLQNMESSSPKDDVLPYAVLYGQRMQSLHTEGVNTKLEGFVGKQVVIQGKLVASGGNSILWPASIKQNEAGLIDCLHEGEVPTPDDKLSPLLAKLLAERPGEHIERVSVSFCDDIEVTSEIKPEDIERLQAPLYAMLEKELERYGTEIQATGGLIPALTLRMPLGNVPELAKRADVMYLHSVNEVVTPP